MTILKKAEMMISAARRYDLINVVCACERTMNRARIGKRAIREDAREINEAFAEFNPAKR